MSEANGADAVADRRVHPATVPLRFLGSAPSTILGLPAAYTYASDQGLAQFIGFVGLAALVTFFFQWLSWRSFRYGIGAREIVIESGILSRTRRSIPFDRIQDVDIERGPLHRLFGLAKLRIETGGSGSDEGALDSVSADEAERLRTALRQARGQSPVEPVEEESAPLFAMSVSRVLALGFFNFSMVWIASLFALLQTFESLLPFDIYDPGRWIGVAGNQLDGRWSIGAIAAVAMLALLLGLVTGVVRTFGRDFGFRLTLEPQGFRRVRGLLTRSEVLIPRRRVQLGLIQTGPIRRRFGWSALFFQTLGGRGGKGEGGRQPVAPLARAGEIAPILAAHGTLRTVDGAALSIVSKRHLLRLLARVVLPPLIVIAAATIAFPPILLALAGLPLLVAIAWLKRRAHRYGMVGELLFIRSCIWRQRLWIVPVANIQSLRLTRTWLQRRLGLATVAIDTAGGAAFDAPRIVDLHEPVARDLIATLRSPP